MIVKNDVKQTSNLKNRKNGFNSDFKLCPRAFNSVLEQNTLCQYTKCGEIPKKYQIFYLDVENTKIKI